MSESYDEVARVVGDPAEGELNDLEEQLHEVQDSHNLKPYRAHQS